MSVRLTSAVWDLPIPATEKLVLMCLADFANDDGGDCWPSVSTIARRCSKGERTVQGAIKWLTDNGYLKANLRDGKSSEYTVNPRNFCTPAEIAPRRKQRRPPQLLQETPATSAPYPPENHQEPPISETARDECEVVADLWNGMAKSIGLARCAGFKGQRRKACQARIRDHGLEAIRQAIEHIPKSAFLRGEVGNWSGANISFLLRPDTVIKILEGQYDDRPRPSQTAPRHSNGIAAALDRKIGLGEPSGTVDGRTTGIGRGDSPRAIAGPPGL